MIQPTPPRAFARNIPLFYLFQFVRGFHFWLPIWFLFLQSQHGLSFTEIGLIEALFGAATILSEIPTGAVADRFGRRIAMALGTTGFAASITLFAVLNFPLLIIGYVGMSVARTLISGSDNALLYDSLRVLGRTDEYERHEGRTRAIATSSLLAATLLSGPIAALLGLQAAILCSAAGMILAAACALALREPPRSESAYAGSAPSADTKSNPPILHEIRTAARLVFQARTVFWTILFAGILLATLDLPDFFIQPFIRSHNVNPTDALDRGFIFSALMLPSFVAIVAASLLAAPLAKRLGEARSLPTMLLVGAAVFLPILIADHLSLIAIFALLSGAVAVVNPLANGYINRRIPSDQRATVLSIFSMATGVMITILIPASSVLVDQFDFRAGFALAFVLLTIGGGLLWLSWHRAHNDIAPT